MVEHAKLIVFTMQRNPSTSGKTVPNKIPFQFTRPYVIKILETLVNHNNEYLKNMVHKEAV
jgi:hypothetical protein